MAVLVTAIHVFLACVRKTWMAGTRRTRPAMTAKGVKLRYIRRLVLGLARAGGAKIGAAGREGKGGRKSRCSVRPPSLERGDRPFGTPTRAGNTGAASTGGGWSVGSPIRFGAWMRCDNGKLARLGRRDKDVAGAARLSIAQGVGN